MTAVPVTRLKIKRIRRYDAEEFFEFIKDKEGRRELIDGRIYMMASPSVNHQRIIGRIYKKLSDYFAGKTCEPFIAPLDVVLFEKNKEDKSQNVFQPDVFVVCDPEKIGENRINGAPDFIIEIVSEGTASHDYIKKLNAYMKYGVREYWIVNPKTKQDSVYINGEQFETYTYSFEDKIKVSIFEDLEIDFKELDL